MKRMAVLLLPVCVACSGGSGEGDAGSAPTADAGADRDAFVAQDAGTWSPSDGGVGSCPGGDVLPTADDLLRTTMENDTQVDVVFVTPLREGSPEELTFRIVMTNHTCSIPGYDEEIEGKILVETADGLSLDVGYASEILSTDSHHPVVLLTLPSTLDGSPIIGCDTEWIRLTLQGIDGGDRVFQWEQDVILPAARP